MPYLEKCKRYGTETSHGSKYIRNRAHALCLLHNKIYKRKIRIYKTIFFLKQQHKTKETQRYVCQHIAYTWSKFEPRFRYQLLTLTADPIPSTLLHVRENRIRNFGYLNRKGKSSYLNQNALNFRSSTHQKCFTNFCFLQVIGTWYPLMHSPNDMDNEIDCIVLKVGRPEGNISLMTRRAYVIRWVHNIDCLFTAILIR